MTVDPFDALENSVRAAHPGAEIVLCAPVEGAEPLNGAVAVHVSAPSPHWLVVSQGFTELWDKESDDPDVSGFGFELSCRIPAVEAQLDFGWVLHWMQGIRDYLATTETFIGSGHCMPLVAPATRDEICNVLFVEDVGLAPTRSRNGNHGYLQMVGVNVAEHDTARSWDVLAFSDLMRARDPLLQTIAGRPSFLADASFLVDMERAMASRAASVGMRGQLPLHWEVHGGLVRGKRLDIHVDLACIPDLLMAIKHRVRHGEEMVLFGGPRSGDSLVCFRPGPAGWSIEKREGMRGAVIFLPPEAIEPLTNRLSQLMTEGPQPQELELPGVNGARLFIASVANPR
ncbi:MAG: suppressor of fused domain protein [Kofleriaceae bacterium]|nr:suppressor of fused domain protein [Kofleriaceae bacterium]